MRRAAQRRHSRGRGARAHLHEHLRRHVAADVVSKRVAARQERHCSVRRAATASPCLALRARAASPLRLSCASCRPRAACGADTEQGARARLHFACHHLPFRKKRPSLPFPLEAVATGACAGWTAARCFLTRTRKRAQTTRAASTHRRRLASASRGLTPPLRASCSRRLMTMTISARRGMARKALSRVPRTSRVAGARSGGGGRATPPRRCALSAATKPDGQSTASAARHSRC